MGIARYRLWLGASAMLMLVALYMIFIFAPAEKEMGDIQRIFYIHVALAWNGFLAFAVVFVCSILYLWKRHPRWDRLAHSAAEIGVLFITLVLITGPIWARPVWGTWWEWEARLTSSLVLWLTYLSYLLVRSFAAEESMGARFAAVVGIVGFINVPIVYLSVDLWRTQHPPELVSDLGGDMLATLLVSIAAMTLLHSLLLYHRVSVRNMTVRVKRLRQRVDEFEDEREDFYG